MLSKLLVGFYRIVHGKLHWRGAGWLISRCAPVLPGLQAFPVAVPGVGVAVLDFRDSAAFFIMNASLGDFNDNAVLLRCLESVLRPGDVLWDVGANVGLVSGHFAHPRYQLSSLHAFEPNPGPRKTLASLLAGVPKAAIHPFGLGDKDQTITMSVSSVGSGLGTMLEAQGGGERIQVQVRAGDAVRRELQLPAPDVIKIDVEGFEPNVFAGLARTITEKRPIIVFEHSHLSDEQVGQLVLPDYLRYFLLYDGTASATFESRGRGPDAILIPREKAHLFNPEKIGGAWNPARANSLVS